jgi:hypothetical protein
MRRRAGVRLLVATALFALPASVRATSGTKATLRAAPQEAGERDLTGTSGPALSVGLGSQYPLLGAQLAYYLQMPEVSFRLTPYAGIGTQLCSGCLGAAFGVMGSFGRQHRLVVDAFYGTVGSSWYSLHGEPRHELVTWGVGLAVGYEQMLRSGLFWRVEGGASYAFGPPIFPPEDRFGPALSLGVGYKIQ